MLIKVWEVWFDIPHISDLSNSNISLLSTSGITVGIPHVPQILLFFAMRASVLSKEKVVTLIGLQEQKIGVRELTRCQVLTRNMIFKNLVLFSM